MSAMHIYELRAQPDRYPGFIQMFDSYEPDPERWKEHMAARCLDRGSLPFGADYEPVKLEFNDEAKRKNVAGDICLSMQPFVVLSERARTVLDAFLSPVGEYLPVIAPVHGFIGYRVLERLAGCVDLDHSTYVQADNGKILVRKAAMYGSKLGGHHLFAIPESPTGLFISEEFKQAVESAKLKGFDFRREVRLT